MVGKIHDAGRENCYFTSVNVSMLGFGCGVSQYPQFYYQDLDKYQVLPLPYLGSLEGDNWRKLFKKMGVIFGRSSRHICLGNY